MLTEQIRVLVADDHAVVRHGLRVFLDLQPDIAVVGEATDGSEAVDAARRLRPNVVLMDLVMPGMDGIAATRAVRESCPESRVLVLTSYAEDDQVVAAIRAGASGYLLKDASPDEVGDSVRAVHRGESLLHAEALSSVMRELASPSRMPEGTVTILFTDVEDSSGVFERLGDEGARDLFRTHERLLAEVVEKHGGCEVKHQGDGVMLAFSSARKALLCAAEIQRTVDDGDDTLSVRIGLNTGEVIAEERDYFGSTVILAARVAALARGGEILLTQATKVLAGRTALRLVDRGEQQLRGLSDPCRLYEAVWRDAAAR